MTTPRFSGPRFRWSRNLLYVAGTSLLLALPPAAHSAVGPDLSVTKSCVVNGVSGGQQSVLCTVTITNIGANPSLAPLTVSDTPTAPSGATYTGAGGSLPIGCSLGAGPVLPIPCSANVSLQPSESGTALFSFRIPEGGSFSNCVTVTVPRNAGNPGDLSPANNTNICTSLGGGNSGGGDDGPDEGGGSVTFAKTVVNRTSHRTPASFDIHYQCDPDASTVQTLTLAAPGYQQAVPVPAGGQCKFTEVPPTAPKGCRWIVSYPDGQYGKDGDRLVVRNELDCGGGGDGGGGGEGKITFVKKILNDTPHQVTGPFEIELKCTPAAASGSVMLSGPGFQQSVAVSARAECKFQEVVPPAPKGCRWTVNYPNGQTARAGDTVYVENVLTCGDGPKACPRGQSLDSFPGSDVKYCCDGKPGSDKFCCSRVGDARPTTGKR